MAPKRTSQASPRKTRSEDPPLQIFVRRGALWRYNSLASKAAELPVAIRWDQRSGDRRTASTPVKDARRKGERRREPPFTWTAADFVLVEKPVASTKSARKPVAKSRSRRG
jgi:hypothetical protein